MTSVTPHSLLWRCIALLAVLAVVRTLAPSRTEFVVRPLLSTTSPSTVDSLHYNAKALQELRDDLARERNALEQLKHSLSIAASNSNDTSHSSSTASVRAADERANDVISHKESLPYPPGMFAAEKSAHLSGTQPPPTDVTSVESVAQTGTSAIDSIESNHHLPPRLPELPSNECPTIVIPEAMHIELGQQVEHLWNALSITLALRNACVVLPPMMAHTPSQPYRPVRFTQVWDEASLSHTGLRFVPIELCYEPKVLSVFDDAGAPSAVIKTFANHLAYAYPTMQPNNLIVDDTLGYRFPNVSVVQDNVANVAQYISARAPLRPRRHCTVLGRLHASIGINADVVRSFRAAPSVTRFVSARFGDASSMIFVRLRWSDPLCSRLRPGHICLLSGVEAPLADYTHAIAMAMKQANVTQVYVAAPPIVPETVRAYLAERLPVVESVLLQVEGDFFSANVVERELAARARVFVPDGGTWDTGVQMSRKAFVPHLYNEDFSSQTMIEEWRAAGAPLLAGPVALGAPAAYQLRAGMHLAVPPPQQLAVSAAQPPVPAGGVTPQTQDISKVQAPAAQARSVATPSPQAQTSATRATAAQQTEKGGTLPNTQKEIATYADAPSVVGNRTVTGSRQTREEASGGNDENDMAGWMGDGERRNFEGRGGDDEWYDENDEDDEDVEVKRQAKDLRARGLQP